MASRHQYATTSLTLSGINKEEKETQDRKEVRPNLDPGITPYTPPIYTIRSEQSLNPKAQINSNKIEHDWTNTLNLIQEYLKLTTI